MAMASSKEMQQTSRPLTHRSSVSVTSSSGLPSRQAHSRTGSHSILSSSLNANHRVTRRKSMTNASHVAAVAAALKEANLDGVGPVPIATGSRRNTSSKSAAARAAIVGSLPSPPASLPGHKFHMGKMEMPESAIEDDPQDQSGEEGANRVQNARVRRASDGQPLIKERRKSNRVELRCEKCGKGYKHSSCLTKHLWEHTPEWSLTSKLLISKHQQVQLLEAASVLVAMNGKEDTSTTTPPESAKDFQSDPESAASPEASGYSNSRQSSADTTPPPHSEGLAAVGSSEQTFPKRYSSGGGFGRSYQSAPSTHSLLTSSMPNGFTHFRQDSQDRRPPSSGRNHTGQDDRDLAEAVGMLSCSFGSNSGSRTVNLPADVPPVPPLPTRYLGEAASISSTGFLSSYPSRQPESFTRGEARREAKASDNDEDEMMEEDDFDRRSRSRSDEDDDGVFGRMEE